MEQADVDRIEQDVQSRFPEGLVRQVVLLHYGDDPVVEPGDLAMRVIIDMAGHGSVEEFHDSHKAALKQLRSDAERKLPELRRIEFTTAGNDKARFVIGLGRSDERGGMTPVMARLEPADLETLDTLITAGIATNRAEAVRWALRLSA